MKTKRRLYVPDAALAAGAEITLGAAQAHYLTSVLRLQAGAAVHVFNAAHGEWLGELRGKKQEARIILKHQTRAPLPSPLSHLTLSFSPLKKDRTDFLVEKASELGAHQLQPIFTDHTQSDRVNIERLQLTAIEAAEQCDRLDAPQVLAPLKLENYLQNLPRDVLVFLAAESGAALPIAEAFLSLSSRKLAKHGELASRCEASIRDPMTIKKPDCPGIPDLATLVRDDKFNHIHFIIGPEGGFSAAEFERFDRYPNIHRLRLGPRLLRAETAAIAVLSAFQALLGDWQTMPD